MKIICIGSNYGNHVKDTNKVVSPGLVFFMKPDTALLRNNDPFYYPDFTKDLRYELGLVLRIDKAGRSISEKAAGRYYSEIGLGIDFTAHDILCENSALGLPWESAKAFDYSAPVGPEFIPTSEIDDLRNIRFRLDINDITVRQGTSADTIFRFEAVVSHVSRFVTLKIGDLIFVGTSAVADKAKIGDRLQARLNDRLLMDFEIK